MTIARQEWWDSLPREEKEIRKIIKRSKHQIHSYKQEMTAVLSECKQNGWPISSITEKILNSYKREMRTAKAFIKILRKQIAMRPQVVPFSDVLTRQPKLKCPCCSHRFIRHAPYCLVCGQKLRWE